MRGKGHGSKGNDQHKKPYGDFDCRIHMRNLAGSALCPQPAMTYGLAMYEFDSFSTLSLMGQIGLLMLSTIMAALLCLIMIYLARRVPWWLSLLGAGVLLWMFLWLSPQIYYQYYRIIIEDLPQQLVIKLPPSLNELLAILFFQSATNLATHSAAILGWILVGIALYVGLRRTAAN